MFDIQYNISRYTKKQKNKTANDKTQSSETDPAVTQRLKFAAKDIKTEGITSAYI